MVLEYKQLVKCSLTDGSIIKDYTSMFFDLRRPATIPYEIWDMIGPNSPGGN